MLEKRGTVAETLYIVAEKVRIYYILWAQHIVRPLCPILLYIVYILYIVQQIQQGTIYSGHKMLWLVAVGRHKILWWGWGRFWAGRERDSVIQCLRAHKGRPKIFLSRYKAGFKWGRLGFHRYKGRLNISIIRYVNFSFEINTSIQIGVFDIFQQI